MNEQNKYIEKLTHLVKGKKYHLFTMGCQLNEKESEKAKMKDDHIINEIISARQHNEKSDTDTSEGGVDINALVEDIF